MGRWFNQDPALQLVNPFLYCGNSPGMYIDPDGEWIWLVVAVVAGAYVGGVQSSGSWNPTTWDWSSGQLWGAMGIGGLAGLAGYGVGTWVMGSFAVSGTVGATIYQGGAIAGAISGAAAGGTTGLISGSGIAWVHGANFWDGLENGAKMSMYGMATGGLMGGAVGGITSTIRGNDFFTGAPLKPNVTPTVTLPKEQLEAQIRENAQRGTNSNVSTKFDYPDNNGFQSTPKDGILEKGMVIDRYGNPNGNFFAPEGTPVSMRSLPPTSNTNILNAYEVVKPFPVKLGPAAPAFGQPGGGMQYMTPKPTDVLMRGGYIKPIK